MFEFLIQLLVFAILAGLVWWILTLIPLPDPVGRIVQVVFVVVCVLILIFMLLGLLGAGPRLGIRTP